MDQLDETAVAINEAAPFGGLPAAVRAFQATGALRAALALEDCEPVNVDAGGAAIIVLGALPSIAALAPDLEAEFWAFSVGQIEHVRSLALATLYAHARHRFHAAPAAVTPALVKDVAARRKQFVSMYRMAVEFGLLGAAPLRELRHANGHLNVAMDLLGVAQLFVEHWARLEGQIPLQHAEVLAAIDQATQLAEALSKREPRGKGGAVWRLEKRRSFTLMSNAYKDLRGMVAWVRRHERDVDSIAPSFHYRKPRPARSDATPRS